MEVRQGCSTVIIILLFPDTPTIERAACSQARSPFHLFFPIQQICIADLQDMGNDFQFNVRNKPASAFHALDSIFIHIQPWQDARFAGEYPTPEEFFYYKGEKLHRNFMEQLESLYHADRSGMWHSFHFYPNSAKISKKSGL